MELYGITDAKAQEKMQADVADFMRLRLKNVLETVRYDVVDAVLSDVDDLYAVSLRAEAVAAFVSDAKAEANIQAFVRTANLAKKAETAKVDAELFTTAEEKDLYKVYTVAASSVASLVAAHNYAGAIAALTELSAPINAFFDGVMVMDKDESIKNNRLGLLRLIDELVRKAADFTKIVL